VPARQRNCEGALRLLDRAVYILHGARGVGHADLAIPGGPLPLKSKVFFFYNKKRRKKLVFSSNQIH
jgi:hypothetical protein